MYVFILSPLSPESSNPVLTGVKGTLLEKQTKKTTDRLWGKPALLTVLVNNPALNGCLPPA